MPTRAEVVTGVLEASPALPVAEAAAEVKTGTAPDEAALEIDAPALEMASVESRLV